MPKVPVIFIAHGAPTFALEPGKLGAPLTTLGKKLSGVNPVLVVSPHWQTQVLKVTANKSPATLHDFGGFPLALDGFQYPAPGHFQFAVEARRLLVGAGFQVSLDDQHGLDHDAWVPLLHLLPAPAIPVFQVSMPRTPRGVWLPVNRIRPRFLEMASGKSLVATQGVPSGYATRFRKDSLTASARRFHGFNKTTRHCRQPASGIHQPRPSACGTGESAGWCQPGNRGPD